MIEIISIEDAFLAALAPVLKEGARTLASYAEEIGTDDIQRMVSRVPSVYVVWSGSELRIINQVDHYVARVLVLACDANLRGESAARRGDVLSPGAYHLLDRCRSLLHRKYVIPGWSIARCQSEGILAADRQAVVCQAVYEVVTRIAP
jgi:phage gp37-like protein